VLCHHSDRHRLHWCSRYLRVRVEVVSCCSTRWYFFACILSGRWSNLIYIPLVPILMSWLMLPSRTMRLAVDRKMAYFSESLVTSIPYFILAFIPIWPMWPPRPWQLLHILRFADFGLNFTQVGVNSFQAGRGASPFMPQIMTFVLFLLPFPGCWSLQVDCCCYFWDWAVKTPICWPPLSPHLSFYP